MNCGSPAWRLSGFRCCTREVRNLRPKWEIEMKALKTDDPLFQRLMVTILVRPDKVDGLNANDAKSFEHFLIAPETQAQIRAFRIPSFAGQVWRPAGRHNSGPYLSSGK